MLRLQPLGNYVLLSNCFSQLKYWNIPLILISSEQDMDSEQKICTTCSSFFFNVDSFTFFIGNLVRSIHKSKHNTHKKKNQTSAGLVARSFFYRSVCMFTRFTSLHLLQSTSITTGGLERPMYTLATVEERRRRKKTVFCINENYWEKNPLTLEL